MPKSCYCQLMDSETCQARECFWEQPRYFYRVTTRMALHNPIAYNEDVTRAMMEAQAHDYSIKQNPLILLKSGLFRGDILLEIETPVDREACRNESDNASCRKLQGAFYMVATKAPPFRIGIAVDKLIRELKKQERKVQDIYLCLINCPGCSKEKGHQAVIFAHLELP